jgi:hypothetical protein
MSRKLATHLTVAALCLVAVRSADAQRPGGNARPQFSVVASGENVILIDQREGRTWLLAHSPAGGTPAWVPIQRIDSPEEAQHWREEQHAFAEQREREHREQHEREMRERLEDRRREMARHREEFEQRVQKERERAEQQRQQQELRQKKEAEQPQLPDASREIPEVQPAVPEAAGARERLKKLGQQTQRAMLESLQQHRKRMIEQFGKEHPAVKSIGEQIERLSRELKKAAGEPEESTKGKKDRSDAKRDAGPPKPPPQKKPPQPSKEELEKKESSILESIQKQMDALKRQVDLESSRKQLDEVKRQVELESIKKLEGVKRQINQESIQKEIDAVKRQVDVESIQKQLDAAKRQVDALRSLQDEIESRERDRVVAEILRLLQAAEKSLLQEQGPDHPMVQAVRAKLEAVRNSSEDSSHRDSGSSETEAETSEDAERPDDAKDDERIEDVEDAVSDAAEPAEDQ